LRSDNQLSPHATGWLVCWPELLTLARASTLARAAPLAKAGASDVGQNLRFACRPDLFAGGRTFSVPCRITFSILLQPPLEESMKVYLRERKYAAKAGKKPERLSPDTFWVCFRAGKRLKEPHSDSYGFAMAKRKTMKVISQNWILRKERVLKSTRMWVRRRRKRTM